MRFNVYDHFLTGKVTLVKKRAGECNDGPPFEGVQFVLNPHFPHTEDDDDTPAVTFWHHEDDVNYRNLLITSFSKALRLLGVTELPPEEAYAKEQILYMDETKTRRVNSPAPG